MVVVVEDWVGIVVVVVVMVLVMEMVISVVFVGW